MSSWLSNISVNLKLALGFGLVLALTCLMAIGNWFSLDTLIDRSNWMSDITRLNSALTNLRVARLQYMLTKGDETAAQNVQTNLDAFEAQQKQLLNTFKSPENLKLLNEQHDLINHYKNALMAMRKAYLESATSRELMDSSAKTVLAEIATLDARTLQRPAGEEGRFEQYQAVIKVREQFLLARDLARAYTASPTAATEQAALNQLATATASLAGLNAFFSTTAADTLSTLSEAMGGYTQALKVFTETEKTWLIAAQT